MSREPGRAPDFARLAMELGRAQSEWELGNRGKAESILRMIGSLAYADAKERGPHDPVPE